MVPDSAKKIVAHSSWLPVALVGVVCFSICLGAGSGLPDRTEAGAVGAEQQQDAKPVVVARVAEPSGFVLLFSGNWSGHLEPCGCTEKQLGGIDRRTDVIKEIAGKPQERLLLEAGPVIESQDRQGQLKLETFLYSMGQLNYDAIGLTGAEMLLLRDKIVMDAAERPTLICSNMDGAGRKKFGAEEFVTKTISFKGQKLECLVMSVVDPTGLADDKLRNELHLEDPVASVKKILTVQSVLPGQSSKDKLVVVMLSAENASLEQKLQKIAALDILVTKGVSDTPESGSAQSNSPLVITTGKLGKYLARVDIAGAQVDSAEHYQFTAVEIDARFRRDPAIVNIIDDYQLRLQIEDLVADESAINRRGLDEGNRFSGNASCADGSDCHQEVYKKWQSFGHAHAMETLIEENRQYDPECVTCHSVGMLYESGYRSMDRTPDLADVGCEMCHGPGVNHIEDTYSEYKNQFTGCEDCHNHETSPSFDSQRKEYFNKIRHWEEPRKYWE